MKRLEKSVIYIIGGRAVRASRLHGFGQDGGTFVLVARDEDKLARRMDDGSLSAASMPSFAASTTGRHPTHVNVKGCSSTWQACLDPRWVGDIPENKRDDLLGRHFAGTKESSPDLSR